MNEKFYVYFGVVFIVPASGDATFCAFLTDNKFASRKMEWRNLKAVEYGKKWVDLFQELWRKKFFFFFFAQIFEIKTN